MFFSAYQKPLNLYLYIPQPPICPSNQLPQGSNQGGTSEILAKNQRQDFEDLVTKFIEQLHARGHSIDNLRNIFLQAADSLGVSRRISNENMLETNNDNSLYIHWTYHPKDLQCQDIRRLYESILEPHTPHDRMVVAISRPKNLRDALTKTELKLPENINLHDLIPQQDIHSN